MPVEKKAWLRLAWLAVVYLMNVVVIALLQQL